MLTSLYELKALNNLFQVNVPKVGFYQQTCVEAKLGADIKLDLMMSFRETVQVKNLV